MSPPTHRQLHPSLATIRPSLLVYPVLIIALRRASGAAPLVSSGMLIVRSILNPRKDAFLIFYNIQSTVELIKLWRPGASSF